MVYRVLFALLIVFMAVACSDSASRGLSAKQATGTNATLPKVPSDPIQRAPFTVGTLPQSSGASPAGEYGIDIPLDVPDGRAAMAPMLSLGFSSGAGVDNAGLGWSLRGATSFIRVCAPPFASRGLVRLPDSFCLDQQVLVSIAPGEWRTENESFAKIVSMPVDATEPTSWEVFAKEGNIRTYNAVRYDGTNTRFWALASERDRLGNRIDYFYRHEETAPFKKFVFDIERIEYTATINQPARRKVEFHYEPSNSPAFVRVWDAHAQAYHRRDVSNVLTSIEMFGPNENATTELAWSYSLSYEPSADTGRMLLSSIERCGALGGCLQGTRC
jgi:hypothetical protein